MKRGFLFLCVLSAVYWGASRSAAWAQGRELPPGPPGSAAARMRTMNEVEPRTPIHELPYAITNSGAYFFAHSLATTNSSNGVKICANNVVLDMSGFSLTCAVGIGFNDGIVVDGARERVTIRNGLLQGWPGSGINADAGRNCEFENMVVRDCLGDGLKAGAWANVRSCLAMENGGNGFTAGQASKLTDCRAHQNEGAGYVMGAYSQAAECAAVANEGQGFAMGQHGVFERCLAALNKNNGFLLAGFTRVASCASFENGFGAGGAGIYALGDYNVIRECQFGGNDVGLRFPPTGARENLVLGNYASGNLSNFVWGLQNAYGEPQDLSSGVVITNASPWSNFSD